MWSVEPLKCRKYGEPSSEHHAHANRNTKRLVLDLATQTVDRDVEIVPGYQFSHDELPRGFGVRLGMVLRDTVI